MPTVHAFQFNFLTHRVAMENNAQHKTQDTLTLDLYTGTLSQYFCRFLYVNKSSLF